MLHNNPAEPENLGGNSRAGNGDEAPDCSNQQFGVSDLSVIAMPALSLPPLPAPAGTVPPEFRAAVQAKKAGSYNPLWLIPL